jgi:hypothetical protein
MRKIILVASIILALLGLGLIFYGQANLYQARAFPLEIIVSCPRYEEMDVFTECSDQQYTKPGWLNCFWHEWDVEGCRYYNPICFRCSDTPCMNCNKSHTEPPICPEGKEWHYDVITCSEEGKCDRWKTYAKICESAEPPKPVARTEFIYAGIVSLIASLTLAGFYFIKRKK